METATPKIFAAMIGIMAEMEPITKDRRNKEQGYAFRGVEDIMKAANPLFVKYQVIPVCVKTETVSDENVKSKAGTAGFARCRRYTYRFYAIDGSSIDSVFEGEGIDYGDKATRKASSSGYADMLFKTFVVPTEEDDIENHSHELSADPAPEKTYSPRKSDDPELPWMTESQCDTSVYNIEKGLYDGQSPEFVVAKAREKFAVKTAFADKLKAAVLARQAITDKMTYEERMAKPITPAK